VIFQLDVCQGRVQRLRQHHWWYSSSMKSSDIKGIYKNYRTCSALTELPWQLPAELQRYIVPADDMGVPKKRKLPCHLQSENKLGQSQRSQNNPNARRRTARLKKKKHVGEEVSGEGLGGFFSEPGQVQYGFGEGSGEGVGASVCASFCVSRLLCVKISLCKNYSV